MPVCAKMWGYRPVRDALIRDWLSRRTGPTFWETRPGQIKHQTKTVYAAIHYTACCIQTPTLQSQLGRRRRRLDDAVVRVKLYDVLKIFFKSVAFVESKRPWGNAVAGCIQRHPEHRLELSDRVALYNPAKSA